MALPWSSPHTSVSTPNSKRSHPIAGYISTRLHLRFIHNHLPIITPYYTIIYYNIIVN